ncbi:helix-turn-helix domain-containing protein [Desulfovibrio sp. OttesenSCG-928-G11]|nr:helix-turn-helix domain-containing protein [Desulfovibrio sp. OttesenSCG-928-G11]
MKEDAITHEIFRKRLKEFTDTTGKNQEDLARAAGVTPQAISGVMKKSFPKADTLEGWARELDMNVNWLLTGRGEMFLSRAEDASGPAIRELCSELSELKEELRLLQKKHIAALEELRRFQISEPVKFYGTAEGNGAGVLHEPMTDYGPGKDGTE